MFKFLDGQAFKLCPIFVDSASCLFTKWNNFLGVCSSKNSNWVILTPPEKKLNNQTDTAAHIYIILSERFRFHSCHSLKVLCHQFFFFAVRTVPGHNMYNCMCNNSGSKVIVIMRRRTAAAPQRRPGGCISNALPKFIVVTVPTTVLYGKSMPEECNFAEKRIFEMSFSLRQCISSAVFQILYCCCWLAGCFSLKQRRRRGVVCGSGGDLDPRSRPQRLLQKLRNNYENRGAGLTFKRT